MYWYGEYELYCEFRYQRFLRAVCLSRGRMEDGTSLQQWKTCLPVRTAFHPLHFIHETLNHSIAPGHAASIGNRLRIVSQPIDKSDQLGTSLPRSGSSLQKTSVF